jgi:Uma2 family endonuclease
VAVIEVAGSSLDYDRTTKQRLYAVAGISTLIVNLQDERVELFEQPQGEQYAQSRTFERGSKLALGGIEIAVNDLLPAAS